VKERIKNLDAENYNHGHKYSQMGIQPIFETILSDGESNLVPGLFSLYVGIFNYTYQKSKNSEKTRSLGVRLTGKAL